jgi:hypothetical protein
MRTAPRILIGTGIVAGVATIIVKLLTDDVHTFKETSPPDISPPPPGKTGYKLVDAMLPKLETLASSNGIPLGLLIGWVVKESKGKLATKPQPGPGDTSMDERGYFQLSPDESKKLKLDHQRLSTDSDYSLQAGIDLIHEYEGTVQGLNVPAATSYSAFYWLLVKLCHTVGTGQTKKWVQAALADGAAGSWSDFETYVRGKSWKGPQPKKWLDFMDELYAVGKPFGFGDAASVGPAIVGNIRCSGLIGLDIFAS